MYNIKSGIMTYAIRVQSIIDQLSSGPSYTI